jgi:UDP-N-acetylglucosamine pyrophosphorylase
MGTAHAVSVAKELFSNKDNIGVIYGDNPLISPTIIKELFASLIKEDSKACTLAFRHDKPNHYGRIILDSDGNFQKIVEAKFATEEERKITLCNSGIMAFAPGILEKYIDQCLIQDDSNPGRELYLTNIIEVCCANGEKVSYYQSSEHEAVVGINTQEELLNANSLYQQK